MFKAHNQKSAIVTIQYSGESTPTDELDQFIFEMNSDRDPDAQSSSYQIVCMDFRPVDDPIACSIHGFQYGQLSCGSEFKASAVGEERLSTQANCQTDGMQFDTTFDLFKLFD